MSGSGLVPACRGGRVAMLTPFDVNCAANVLSLLFNDDMVEMASFWMHPSLSVVIRSFKVMINLIEKGVIFIFLQYFLCNIFFLR